ncbi:MAG: type II toxin-antitoxin system CcdA family antitoxin [Thermoproteota archaeon]
MSTEVLSIRIRKGLKDEALRLNINIKEVVERALEEEVKRVKEALLRELLDKVLNSMNISVDEWVKTVRESREKRRQTSGGE